MTKQMISGSRVDRFFEAGSTGDAGLRHYAVGLRHLHARPLMAGMGSSSSEACNFFGFGAASDARALRTTAGETAVSLGAIKDRLVNFIRGERFLTLDPVGGGD